MIIKIPRNTYYKQLNRRNKWLPAFSTQTRFMKIDKVESDRVYGYMNIHGMKLYCSILKEDLTVNINAPSVSNRDIPPAKLPHI